MKYVLIGWAVILIVFVIALTQIPIGKEPLTELYFTHHLELPNEAKVNQTYNFSYTIHNLEYIDRDYTVHITEEYGNATILTDHRVISVPYNATVDIPANFTLNQTFTRARIRVTLIDKNQSIFFWVNEKA